MKGIGADAEYWAGLAQGQVRLQSCSGCGKWHWPAVWRCGTCGSWEHRWQEVPMQGHIFSWTRSWHDFGGADSLKPPYVSVVVELEHPAGVRLLGTLSDPDSTPAIGQRVTAEVQHDSFEGEPLLSLRWTPAPANHSVAVQGV